MKTAPPIRTSLQGIWTSFRMLAIYRLADLIMALAPKDNAGKIWTTAIFEALKAERNLR